MSDGERVITAEADAVRMDGVEDIETVIVTDTVRVTAVVTVVVVVPRLTVRLPPEAEVD